jgi:hypothetical protein
MRLGAMKLGAVTPGAPPGIAGHLHAFPGGQVATVARVHCDALAEHSAMH